MKKLKQAAAVIVAAAVTAGSFAGCSSTDYSMIAGGNKINAGVYINYILNEMSNQMYTMYYSGEITDVSECFDKEIDGTDFKTYVKEEALKSTKEFAAINAKFDELGLTLSDEDSESVSESVSSAWESSSDFYECEGISKESLTQYYELSYKRSAIFDYYYAEGGIEEVTDEDLQSYLDENYIRYKYISIAKSTDEDEDTAAAADEESKALLEGYLAEAEKLSFEDFDAVIDEYDAYQEALEAAEEEEEEAAEEVVEEAEETEETTEEAVTELDSSSADSDESETADESTADESVADDSTAEEETADTDSDEDTDADSEDDSDSEDEEEEEEEEDPYENEVILNYTEYTDTESDSYSETYAAMLEEFKNADYSTPAIYENDGYYYLYVTADISERTDYPEDNKDTLLDEMKGDEFDELIDGWVESLDIDVNEKAIKKYTVQKVYDKQEEYYSSES